METRLSQGGDVDLKNFPDYFKSELMETIIPAGWGESKVSFPDYFKSELMETSSQYRLWTSSKLSRLLQIGINGNSSRLQSFDIKFSTFPITSNRN